MTRHERQRPPSRRPCATTKVLWSTEAGEHAFFVTVGFDPVTARPVEVMYADGQKTGTQLRHSIEDACVLLSLLLQRGATLAEIGQNLGTVPIYGADRPASPVGAIVAIMAEGAP